MKYKLILASVVLAAAAVLACGDDAPPTQSGQAKVNGGNAPVSISTTAAPVSTPAPPVPTPTSFTGTINQLMVRGTVEASMSVDTATPAPESSTVVAAAASESGASDKSVNGSAPPAAMQETPTPEPPTPAPSPVPLATPPTTSAQLPTAEPAAQTDGKVWHKEFEPVVDKTERTQQELEELLTVSPYQQEVLNGIRHVYELNNSRDFVRGEKFKVYSSPTEWQEFTCGPEIGVSLDPNVNPTHTEYSHFLFIWIENADATGKFEKKEYCIGVSKYVDWKNPEPPLPLLNDNDRYLLTREVFDSEISHLSELKNKFGYMGTGGAKIVFKRQVEDRSFTPRPSEGFNYPYIQDGDSFIRDPDTNEAYDCTSALLPNALWSDERGFVGITLDDMRTLLIDPSYRPFSEDNIPAIEKAREAGIFFVYMNIHLGGRYETRTTCWRVVNVDEVPYEPCLFCQYWIHYD